MQNPQPQPVDTAAAESLQSMVKAARAGVKEVRERLIRNYQPFILKIAANVSHRYLRDGVDDEVGVALMGFNEAIDCYDLHGKVPFLSFAQIVIRRRLIDYFREQSKFGRELPLSYFEADGDEERESVPPPFMVRQAEAAHLRREESIERREEIFHLRDILADYGLSFTELARTTPKHKDTRQRLIEIGRELAKNKRLLLRIRKRKALPIREVAEFSGLSRKTIERHRRYLLALALIMDSDLPHLHEYLS